MKIKGDLVQHIRHDDEISVAFSIYADEINSEIYPSVDTHELKSPDNNEGMIKDIVKKYKLKKSDYSVTNEYTESQGKVKNDVNKSIIILRDHKVIIQFNYEYVKVIYNNAEVNTVCKYISDLVTKVKTKKRTKSNINMLAIHSRGGLYMQDFEVKANELDIDKYYSDDFKDKHEKILERLNSSDDNGIVLLYGKPGTGKTSYIRHLCTNIDKELLYVPPDMVSSVTDPSFIAFLMGYPNTVIVLEDAENIIEERNGGSNQAVSNILNLSDGILGDCLKLQIICTFNNEISRIDKALLRKGRLIAKHEFTAIPKEKAQVLIDEAKLGYKAKGDMTLAEIYNNDDEDFIKDDKKKMGFRSN